VTLVRTTAIAVLGGAGIALAVRLSPSGPWTDALLSVGAGTMLALLSTRRPDSAAVPCGALAGVVLVLLQPAWLAVGASCAIAFLPRARRTANAWDSALVVAFAAAGGAVAPIFAGFASPSVGLQIAAAVLAGVALAAPTIVPESTDEALALRRSSRGIGAPAGDALRRSAAFADRIARSDAPEALRDRAGDLARALAADGRAMGRLAEVGGILADDRRAEIAARVVRMSGVLERAWLTGEVSAADTRIRVAVELEQEAEATERAQEVVARTLS